MGVMAKMTGACHDGWKPYRFYDVVHALCNSHHFREFEAIAVVWIRPGRAGDREDP